MVNPYRAIRVKVTSTTSGTGTFSLGAAVSNAFQDFAEAGVPSGSEIDYTAYTATQFESGTGIYTSGAPSTLTRVTIDASSDGIVSPMVPINFAVAPTIIVTLLPKSNPTTGVLNFADTFKSSASAWRAFHQASGLTQTLFIPPSAVTYDNVGTLVAYAPGAVVEGYGATTKIGQFMGGTFSSTIPANARWPRFASANQGDTTITLTDITDAPYFAAGDWVMLEGYDMQGFGFPPNNYFFEFKEISAIDQGTGVITFRNKLRNSYKDTWPLTTAGSFGTDDCGGPATIILMSASWDQLCVCRGMTIPTTVATLYGAARSVLLEDCSFEGVFPAPSDSKDFVMRRCDMSGTGGVMEMDKNVEVFEMDKCYGLPQLLTQSSSINAYRLKDTEIGQVLGVAQHNEITSCTIDKLSLGPQAYGAGGNMIITDSRINILEYTLARKLQYDVLIADAPFANGVFTVARTNVFDIGKDVPLMMIPGHAYFLTAGSSGANLGVCFKLLDVTADATNWYFHTTLPDPIPLPLDADLVTAWSSSTKYFVPHPCQSISVFNCTGANGQLRSLSRAPKGKPIHSHLWTGLVSSGTGNGGKLWGRVERVVLTVHRPYTGTQGTLHYYLTGTVGPNMYFLLPNQALHQAALTVNAKIAGTRVFDLVEGTNIWEDTDVLADLNLGLWSTTAWGGTYSQTISGESPSVWPIIEMEVWTNQGPDVGDMEEVI